MPGLCVEGLESKGLKGVQEQGVQNVSRRNLVGGKGTAPSMLECCRHGLLF